MQEGTKCPRTDEKTTEKYQELVKLLSLNRLFLKLLVGTDWKGTEQEDVTDVPVRDSLKKKKAYKRDSRPKKKESV